MIVVARATGAGARREIEGTGLRSAAGGRRRSRPPERALYVLTTRPSAIAANLQRRNLTKGRAAMALAMIYPEAPDKGGRGIKRSSETDGVSATRLAWSCALAAKISRRLG